MDDCKKFVISNEYNENIMFEAYKLIYKKSFLSRIFEILLVLFFGIVGISEKIYSDSSSSLIIAFCFGLLFLYMEFNINKIHIKRLNRKFDFTENLPDKFIFYDSYYLYEKKNINNDNFGKVNYKEISELYISKNLFVLKATHIKELCIICKDGFELGNVDEFTDFLKRQFEGKVIEV